MYTLLLTKSGVAWGLTGIHRDNDLPAIEWFDGGNGWYQDGKLHRINGPALIVSNGQIHYYIHGQGMSEEDWKQYVHA